MMGRPWHRVGEQTAGVFRAIQFCGLPPLYSVLYDLVGRTTCRVACRRSVPWAAEALLPRSPWISLVEAVNEAESVIAEEANSFLETLLGTKAGSELPDGNSDAFVGEVRCG